MSQKKWVSDSGMFICNYSFSVGGNPIKMFMVFSSAQTLCNGENFATGASLKEAKTLASIIRDNQ